MNKESKNILLIILGVIIIILLICCVGLYLKTERLESSRDNRNDTQEEIPSNNNSNNQNNTNEYITRDEAIEIALKNINVTKNDVYDLEVEIENKYNEMVYEVTFDYNYLEYEYYINAKDGSIVKSFTERH